MSQLSKKIARSLFLLPLSLSFTATLAEASGGVRCSAVFESPEAAQFLQTDMVSYRMSYVRGVHDSPEEYGYRNNRNHFAPRLKSYVSRSAKIGRATDISSPYLNVDSVGDRADNDYLHVQLRGPRGSVLEQMLLIRERERQVSGPDYTTFEVQNNREILDFVSKFPLMEGEREVEAVQALVAQKAAVVARKLQLAKSIPAKPVATMVKAIAPKKDILNTPVSVTHTVKTSFEYLDTTSLRSRLFGSRTKVISSAEDLYHVLDIAADTRGMKVSATELKDAKGRVTEIEFTMSGSRQFVAQALVNVSRSQSEFVSVEARTQELAKMFEKIETQYPSDSHFRQQVKKGLTDLDRIDFMTVSEFDFRD